MPTAPAIPVPPTTQFFRKASPRVPVALASGRFVKFIPLDLNTGLLKTADPAVIEGLTALVGSGRGGVSQITEEEYEDFLKKKLILDNTYKPKSPIDQVQTSGIITIPMPQIVPPPDHPKNPLLPIPYVPAAPVVINPPLAEPPPIKLGKSK